MNTAASLEPLILLFALIVAGLSTMPAIRSAWPPTDSLVLNIISTPDNPRKSEGAFITLQSGRILFAYTQFYSGGAEESPARIVSVPSDDRGLTWSSSPQILVEKRAAQNVMSVSLLRWKSGKIALFYLIKNRPDLLPRSSKTIRPAAIAILPFIIWKMPC